MTTGGSSPQYSFRYSVRCGIGDENHSLDVAEGILMERHQISSRAAFEMLRRHADARRLPIVEVARWLVATRRLL